MQYSTTVRNAKLDAIETAIGASAKLEIFSGAKPENCAASDSGTVLATINLPSDWMAAASNGAKAKSGTWQDTSADESGTAQHFRIKNNAGTVCHIQGTCGLSDADMILDSVQFTQGQTFTVVSFEIQDNNG